MSVLMLITILSGVIVSSYRQVIESRLLNSARLESLTDEFAIRSLLARDILQLPCRLSLNDSLKILARSNLWWERNSCQLSMNDVVFNYFVVDVAENDCAQIDNYHIAHYYRVLIRRVRMNKHATHNYLHVSYIKALKKTSSCITNSYHVKDGLQFYRYI